MAKELKAVPEFDEFGEFKRPSAEKPFVMNGSYGSQITNKVDALDDGVSQQSAPNVLSLINSYKKKSAEKKAVNKPKELLSSISSYKNPVATSLPARVSDSAPSALVDKVEASAAKDDFKEFEDEYRAMYEQGLTKDKDAKGGYTADYNWAPVTQFIDDTFGGNLAKQVRRPMSYDEKIAGLAGIGGKLAERKRKSKADQDERDDKLRAFLETQKKNKNDYNINLGQLANAKDVLGHQRAKTVADKMSDEARLVFDREKLEADIAAGRGGSKEPTAKEAWEHISSGKGGDALVSKLSIKLNNIGDTAVRAMLHDQYKNLIDRGVAPYAAADRAVRIVSGEEGKTLKKDGQKSYQTGVAEGWGEKLWPRSKYFNMDK